MAMEQPVQILETVTEKGWHTYYRGPWDNKIPEEETMQRGPIQELERGILYILLPKVDDPTSIEQTDAFFQRHPNAPSFDVTRYLLEDKGWKEYGLGVGSPWTERIEPGDHIDFLGFEIQDEQVRLLCQSAHTYMPTDVFLRSLGSLLDISELE